ncbi:MAG TPA: hypothetical protein VFM18_20240 [Methanosarcina sp.]|nr:hypothetical protein [Methanosarcina sp.]
MIITDFSKIVYASVYVMKDDIKKSSPEEIENILRHMAINSCLTIKKRFQSQYGELVIALDGKNNFRYGIHPNYKFKRKENRDKDDLPWHIIKNCMDKIKEEAKVYWPWKVVWSERAEADDVMVVLTEEVANKNIVENGLLDEIEAEPVLIDTRDQDLFFLQKYPNVTQYDSRDRKVIKLDENYDTWIKEFIIKGDPQSDSVPNVFSDLNCMADGIKQTAAIKSRMAPILAHKNIFDYNDDPKIAKRIRENYQLVIFDGMPIDVRDEIMESWKNAKKASKMVMMKYLIEKKCKNLLEHLEEM